MRIKNSVKVALAVVTVAGALQSAKPALAGTVTVKGSDTMVVLGQRWAEEYMKKHAATTIQVTGGGSGTGISALINGTTDVCEASRAMKDAEKKQLADKAGAPPVEITVAKDGLSVYVNDSNPISELTMDQLKQIFTGKVDNWKALGGPDAKIIPYSRENSSGTYVFFKEHVLQNADYTPRGGRQRRGEGEVRHRVRRRGLRQGDQGPQDQERGHRGRHRARRQDHPGRDLPAVAAAVLLRARQAVGGDLRLHGLGALGRRAGDRDQGGLLPDQVASARSK
jgi:phosphate binding protein